MTVEEQLDRLTGIVSALASSVVAHDDQIGALIKLADKHEMAIAELREYITSVERQFEAYPRRLPPQ